MSHDRTGKQVWYDALKERANQPGTYAVAGGCGWRSWGRLGQR